MKGYQNRVIEEKSELDIRLGDLRDFLNTETFVELGIEEKERLRYQSETMRTYSRILGERIAAFTK